MRIRALLATDAIAQIQADAFLSSLGWTFCSRGALWQAAGDETGSTDSDQVDLYVVDLATGVDDDYLNTPRAADLWLVLSGRPSPWLAAADVQCLRGHFDLGALRDRLLVLCWQRELLCPCVFDRYPFDIVNGNLSLYRSPPDFSSRQFPLEVSVQPVDDEAGGDVVLRVDFSTRTLLVLADASGHGTASALDAGLLVLALSRLFSRSPLSERTVSQLNDYLYLMTAENRYVAAILIELDWSTRTVSLCNCGMPDALLFHRAVFEQRLASSSPPLGLRQESLSARVVALPWDSWKQLLVHSDGIEETGLTYLLARVVRLSCIAKSETAGCGPLPSIPLTFTSAYSDDMSTLAFSIPDFDEIAI